MKEGNTPTENLGILVVEFSSIVHFIFGSNAMSVENLHSLNRSSEAFQVLLIENWCLAMKVVKLPAYCKATKAVEMYDWISNRLFIYYYFSDEAEQ